MKNFFENATRSVTKAWNKDYLTILCQGVAYVCPNMSVTALASRIGKYRNTNSALNPFDINDIKRDLQDILELAELDSISAKDKVSRKFSNCTFDNSKKREIIQIISSTFYKFNPDGKDDKIRELARMLSVSVPAKPENISQGDARISKPYGVKTFDWE